MNLPNRNNTKNELSLSKIGKLKSTGTMGTSSYRSNKNESMNEIKKTNTVGEASLLTNRIRNIQDSVINTDLENSTVNNKNNSHIKTDSITVQHNGKKFTVQNLHSDYVKHVQTIKKVKIIRSNLNSNNSSRNDGGPFTKGGR